jgi:hypothetical protein
LDGKGSGMADEIGDTGLRILGYGRVLFASIVVVLLALFTAPLGHVVRSRGWCLTCFLTVPRKPPKRAAHGLLDMALYAS